MRRPSRTLATVAAMLVLASACSQGDPGRGDRTPGQQATVGLAAGSVAAEDPVRVVAVGDIACPPDRQQTATTCRHRQTARLARDLSPDHVIALGDLQYEKGRLRAFRRSYDESWGRLKAITHPVPGNHEYYTEEARGFYRYFGTEAPGYGAWDAGSWRVYSLNSNCGAVNCKRQVRWLERDLEQNPGRCRLMAMHHPRYSSGRAHGSDPSMRRFWRVAYRHRLDVALAGHDHDYERFAALNGAGDRRPGRGISSFVSGLGGKSQYRRGATAPGSQRFYAGQPGVLVLALMEGGYRWRFRTVDGEVRDRGRRDCV
ncbi:metallophosphoesterase family protein [Nocardioides donggukensis]|uniref:Metallophosphoesterase n=1 Tax=Nocardioides donggukensis TaxID=2774019 RepID=A0A927Q155_9ACTN|nr:metallophosphoesterase [Nocardioides donggukensis]MBD8869702.1 metallophosphoesterase [Nocardioides donggukensis]